MSLWKKLFGRKRSGLPDHPLLDRGGSVVMFVFRDTLDFLEKPETAAVITRIQADRDAIVRQTRSMLGITMRACSGSLALPPEGHAPAARVLAEWIRDGAFGADAADLATEFREILTPEDLQDERAVGERLGFFPFVVAVFPLSRRYADDLQSDLRENFTNYLGKLHFNEAPAVGPIAKAMYFSGEIEMQL